MADKLYTAARTDPAAGSWITFIDRIRHVQLFVNKPDRFVQTDLKISSAVEHTVHVKNNLNQLTENWNDK